MQVSPQQISPLTAITLVLVFLSMGTTFVHAETIVETSASTEINAEVQATPLKTRPLQLLREKSMELKDKARTQIQEVKDQTVDVRTNMQTDIKTATSAPVRRNIIQQAQDRLGELRDTQKELRGNLKERLQALFRTHLGSAIARFNAALRHFDNFVERIESRIEKLQARDVDTTSVETSLEVAVDAIAVATVDVEALSNIVSSVTDASNAETVKAEIRAAIAKAKNSVKAAHRALVATAKELVALVRASATINSTTTVDVDD